MGRRIACMCVRWKVWWQRRRPAARLLNCDMVGEADGGVGCATGGAICPSTHSEEEEELYVIHEASV